MPTLPSTVPQLIECDWCGEDLDPEREARSAKQRWIFKRFCDQYCYEDDLEDRRETGRALTNPDTVGRGHTVGHTAPRGPRPRRRSASQTTPQLVACLFCLARLEPVEEPCSADTRRIRRSYCNWSCYAAHLDSLPVARHNGRGRVLVRAEMAAERAGIVHKFKVGGQKCYLTINVDEQGLVRELFLTVGSAGTPDRAKAQEWGRSMSRLLQYGEDLEYVIKRSRGVKWGPSGIVEGFPGIRFCDGPVDYVARYLEKRILPQQKERKKG